MAVTERFYRDCHLFQFGNGRLLIHWTSAITYVVSLFMVHGGHLPGHDVRQPHLWSNYMSSIHHFDNNGFRYRETLNYIFSSGIWGPTRHTRHLYLKITNSIAIFRLSKPLKTSTKLVGHGIWTLGLPNAGLMRYHEATSLGVLSLCIFAGKQEMEIGIHALMCTWVCMCVRVCVCVRL